MIVDCLGAWGCWGCCAPIRLEAPSLCLIGRRARGRRKLGSAAQIFEEFNVFHNSFMWSFQNHGNVFCLGEGDDVFESLLSDKTFTNVFVAIFVGG